MSQLSILFFDLAVTELALAETTRRLRKPMPDDPSPAGEAAAAVPGTRGLRLAERVARQIEREIVDLGWPVGKLIGSENELIERFGVSRAVFREAARIIEHLNVARMRRGPGGGLIVAEPEPEAVQRAIALYLRFTGVRPEQLFEARAALEIVCVGQAAERITEDGVQRLREVLQQEETLQEEALGSGHHHDLHVIIAELTGNPAMTLFVRVLAELTPQRKRADPKADVANYHRAHQALVDAIVAGDAALAQHRMRRHLDAVSSLVRDQNGPKD
jgi:DNA-binding FadR family transcriptional regulator